MIECVFLSSQYQSPIINNIKEIGFMIFKKDYFGYVYKWTNIKNGKKYIGSHYGSVDDSYTGSGKYFKPAYNKNPENFQMIVLEYLKDDNKRLLLELEQNWLDSVPDIKSNKEYYNFNNYSSGGFRHLTDLDIKKRSETLKEKHLIHGLSEKEKESYKTKIKTRLDRIKNYGFTEKEQEQHSKYGFQIKVILPSGQEKIGRAHV